MQLILTFQNRSKLDILLIVKKLFKQFGSIECPNIYEFKQIFNYLNLNLKEHDAITSDLVLDYLQQNQEGNILIHSQFGINRAPLVLASLVQQITNKDINDIIQTIQFKKPDIKITSQLEQSNKIIQQTEYLQQLSNQLIQQIRTQKDCSFKCSKCRIDVFESSVLLHGLKTECNHYFIERPQNIGEYEQDGKLLCLKCNQKLGDFKSIGSKCNCGEFIYPAYMYNKSKVDRKTK